MRQPPDLPNLPSLRAFGAVGRLQSFRKAGSELFISQSAVSHHIRRLEDDLGVKLFVREARGIRFTEAGASYFESISAALAQIADATAVLTESHRRRSKTLRLSILPSFARRWLMPRLPDWTAEHPDIDLIVDPSLRVADIQAGEADIAIRYGMGNWPGMKATLLLAEQLSPVLSPRLAASLPASPSYADISCLIRIVNSRTTDWDVWLQHAGVTGWRGAETQLTEYGLVIDAVLAGHGVAMGRLWLIDGHVADGSLVMPLSQIARTKRLGYWLVRSGRETSAAMDAFEGWILREIGLERRGLFGNTT